MSEYTEHLVMLALAQKFRQELPAEGPKGPRSAKTKEIRATCHLDEDTMTRLMVAGGREQGPGLIHCFLKDRLSNPESSLDEHLRLRVGLRDLVRT